VAGIFIALGIGSGVLAGLAYANFNKLKHPTTLISVITPEKQAEINKRKQEFIIFGSVAGALLLIGIIIGFFTIQKLR